MNEDIARIIEQMGFDPAKAQRREPRPMSEHAERGRRCVFCGETIYYKPADKAEGKGHVYSEAGKREVGITGICEYCFDETTTFDDEEDE